MTPASESEAQRFSHSTENGIDILEGEVRINPTTGRARVQLPSFERPPEVTLSAYSLPTFDEPGPTPEVLNATQDSFEVKRQSDTSAVIWKWRAEGKLLAPAVPDPAPSLKADPVTAGENKKGPDTWTKVGVIVGVVGAIVGVVGAIAGVLALFLPEFRHFLHLPLP